MGPGGGEGEDEAEVPQAEEAEEGTLLSILYSNPLYGLFTGRRAGAGGAGGGGVARGGERGRAGDDGALATDPIAPVCDLRLRPRLGSGRCWRC